MNFDAFCPTFGPHNPLFTHFLTHLQRLTKAHLKPTSSRNELFCRKTKGPEAALTQHNLSTSYWELVDPVVADPIAQDNDKRNIFQIKVCVYIYIYTVIPLLKYTGGGDKTSQYSYERRCIFVTKIPADLVFRACISFLRIFSASGTPAKKIRVYPGMLPCLVPLCPQMKQIRISFRSRSGS